MQPSHDHNAAHSAAHSADRGVAHGGAHPRGPDAPDLAAELRARGLRVTAQREKVLDAVRALRHATPEQLGDAVEGVDVATVYRTLELLEELGLVKHTHLGHGAPSYRPAEDEHIHLVCHVCGAVADAEPGTVDVLERQLRDDRGFTLDRAHFTVFGRCAACTQRERSDAELSAAAEQEGEDRAGEEQAGDDRAGEEHKGDDHEGKEQSGGAGR